MRDLADRPPSPPRAVLEIASRLDAAGFETWCVGGAVRDALLGEPHLDWDLATSATPGDVQRLFRRTVPKGIEYGTVGVLDRAGLLHEVTTFRRDVRTDGRHAVVEFGASLEEDLARRDFTINAIAVSPKTGEIRDPFDGRADLARGIIRAVGEPDQRMREDRLRALRAIRFASRFEFHIEPSTWRAIERSAPHFGRLSPERVREELDKTIRQVGRPSRALELWRESGALAALIPALTNQPPVAFAALDCIALPSRTGHVARHGARVRARLATLFLGLGERDVKGTLIALRSSNDVVNWVSHLTGRWLELGDRIATALDRPSGPTDGEIRRWSAEIGRTRLAPFLRLASARWAALRQAGSRAPADERVRSLYRRALRIAYRDPIELADLAVDGEDLIAAGFAAGPRLGMILRGLLEAVIETPALNTRDALLALAPSLGAGEKRNS